MVHIAGPMGVKDDERFQRAYWKAFEEFFGKQNAAVVKAMLLAKHPKGEAGNGEIERVCFGLRQTMGWLAEAIERKALQAIGQAGEEPEGPSPPSRARSGQRPDRRSSPP